MHLLVKTLHNVSSRYAPSRILSFTFVHIFKTLQLIDRNGHVSRDTLSQELLLGEGSIKTLIKHLKMENMITTTKKGTTMTEKGKKLYFTIAKYLPSETAVPKCSIAIGEYNYATLLRGQKITPITSGIEQRDIAIRAGAKGATTLIYKSKFLTPDTDYDALKDEKIIQNMLVEKLNPKEDDVMIIGYDDHSIITAELASKAAALFTLENHHAHL